MKNKKRFFKNNLYNIVLYAVYIFLLIYIISCKVDYHVDELLSYNLSNASSWFKPENGVTYLPSNKPFIEAMASNGNLNLKNIWIQQAADCHPPLYYICLHLVCVLFPNNISVWQGGIINICFSLLTLYYVRKILDLFIDDEKTKFLISLYYILCSGVLSINSFIRMYTMLIAFVTIFSYYILNNINKYQKDDFQKIFFIIVLGNLTHYYFIIYSFILTLIVILILKHESRKKELKELITIYILSFATSLVIFPYIIKHLLFSSRGVQSISNIVKSSFIENIIAYFQIINNYIFGGLLLVIIVIIILFLINAFINRNKYQINFLINKRFICMITTCIMFFAIIAKSAPYNIDRYISPVYSIVIISVLCLLYYCLNSLNINKKIIRSTLFVLFSIMLINSFDKCDWQYLNLGNKERMEEAKIYAKNSDAIGIYQSAWKINSSYSEIIQCKSITFYSLQEFENLISNNYKFNDKVAIFVTGEDRKYVIDIFLESYPEYKIVLDNGHYNYVDSIYVAK